MITMSAFVKKQIESLPLLVAYLLLLCLPAVIPYTGLPWNIKHLFSCLLRNFVVATILVYWSGHRTPRIIISSLLFILFLIESYCYFQLGSRFNLSILFLILQTDTNEATGYLSTYFFSWKTLYAFFLPVIILFLAWRVQKLWNKVDVTRLISPWFCAIYWFTIGFSFGDLISAQKPSSIMGLICSSQLIFALLLPIFAYFVIAFSKSQNLRRIVCSTLFIICIVVSFDPAMVGALINVPYTDRATNTYQQIVFSAKQLIDEKVDFNQLENSTESAIANINPDIDVPDKIVIIIGESFSKLHSSLYGYIHNTNPNLSQERDNGNLIVFDNCITRMPLTYNVMTETFSTWSADDTTKFDSQPLWPALLRKVGKKTALIDNHSSRSAGDYWSFKCSAFYSTKLMDDLCFDYRNTDIAVFDNQLIDKYLSDFKDADVTIIHLMGQHLPAESKYPKNFVHFTPKDYPEKEGFKDSEKQTIAHYDNATLYNDSVIKSIIDQYRAEDALIIYFSDHGEEVFDTRHIYGRQTPEGTSPFLWKSLYEVPYMVWFSDNCKVSHPELLQKFIDARHRPIFNCDIAHVLLDIYGIGSSFFRPELSYLNSQFDSIRPRKLYDGTIYKK